MRVLFIAPRLPLPADTGGKIRTFNLIKQIARHHTIDLVCFSFEQDDRDRAKGLEELGISVTLVPMKEPTLPGKIVAVLFSPVPYSAGKYNTKEMGEAINSLAQKNSYDVIHVDHIHMAHYGKSLNAGPRIIDEHNVEYKILERCASVEKSFIKKQMFMNQARKMKQFEAEKISDFSACSVVSDGDGKILKQMVGGEKSIYILPNGVDTGYFCVKENGKGKREEGSEKQEDALVFTGSMDWFPNNDAAIYFCEDILPFIWKAKPRLKFYIVGKGPSKQLKELAAGDERVIVTGCVDDVRVFVARAKVFVVPLRIGGGTRLKILEAMSMERAIVSTSIGAEGIDCTHDSNIFLEDEPEEFAREIVSLLDDPQKRRSLGSAGRALVMEKYDWNIVGEKLAGIYKKITSKTT